MSGDVAQAGSNTKTADARRGSWSLLKTLKLLASDDAEDCSNPTFKMKVCALSFWTSCNVRPHAALAVLELSFSDVPASHVRGCMQLMNCMPFYILVCMVINGRRHL